MQTKIILLPLALLIGSGFGNWTTDASKAKVEFSIKGPMGTVHGNFTGLKATIQFDPNNPGTGSISASIDAKTEGTSHAVSPISTMTCPIFLAVLNASFVKGVI